MMKLVEFKKWFIDIMKKGAGLNVINEEGRVITLESDLQNSDVQSSIEGSQDLINTNDEKASPSKFFSVFKDKYNLYFLLVLIFSIGLRLKFIAFESVWNDSAVHLWYAIKVLEEPAFIFSQQYLLGEYQLPQTITAVYYLITGNILYAGKLMILTYTISGIVLMYLLGIELKDKFTGIMCAILFSLNHLLFFYSLRPLADVPLTVALIFIMYSMVKFERTESRFWGISLGFSFIIAMMHKSQAVLFIISLLIYYSIFKRERIFEKPIIYSWSIPVGVLLLGEIITRLFFSASLIGRLFTLAFSYRGMPYGFEAINGTLWLFSNFLIPFIIFGLLLIIRNKLKRYYFSIVIFVFYLLFFEINVDNTQDRYLLPLLSIGIIVAMVGLRDIGRYVSQEFLSKKNYISEIIVLIMVLLLSANYFFYANFLIDTKNDRFTGYQEAGEWIKENVPLGAPIFAGSPRMIRTFSGREFGGPTRWDKGGSVWYLRDIKYLENRTAFEKDLEELNMKNEVYLEIDVWESTQPRWYFPITFDSLQYFNNLGFNNVKSVVRSVKTNAGVETNVVIIILKKDRGNFSG